MGSNRVEAPRDQGESTFTGLLRRVLRSDTAVVAAVVVDAEGECVDYCSILDPFDAKVYGAHYQVVLWDAAERVAAWSGELAALEVCAKTASVAIQRIDLSYAMLAVVEGTSISDAVRRALVRGVVAFRREAGLSKPAFEVGSHQLQVRMRESVGWPYAPEAFLLLGDSKWTPVQDVLGRWRSPSTELLCFRVRTPEGDELTLAHDDEIHTWEVLPDPDDESEAPFLMEDL